jgi:hypothetical protein
MMINYFAFLEESHKEYLQNIVKELLEEKEVVIDDLTEEDLEFIKKELNKYGYSYLFR